MSRSLWSLLLLAAFVLVGARCLGTFVGAGLDESAGRVEATQGSNIPSDSDELANVTWSDDDADESPKVLPAPLRSEVGEAAVPMLELSLSARADQLLALQSHARSLERPPRI